jgi:hypothetical protein
MDVETFRSYCLSKVDVTESTPFGEETLVFKVNAKCLPLSRSMQCRRGRI